MMHNVRILTTPSKWTNLAMSSGNDGSCSSPAAQLHWALGPCQSFHLGFGDDKNYLLDDKRGPMPANLLVAALSSIFLISSQV